MLFEIVKFGKWLRRKSPRATTSREYTRDLKLFFAWIDKPPPKVTVRDIDAYIEHCQTVLGHAVATINRRLAAIRSFYRFLELDADDGPPNPVIPERHYVRQGTRLPRDVQDEDVERLLAVIDSKRDRAMVLLMLRCSLRVGEVHNLSLGDLYLQPSQRSDAAAHGPSLPRLWLRGKRDSQRVVYLSPQALAALNGWLAVRPNADDQAVFLSSRMQRISVRAIQERLAHYSRLAGVHVTGHQLRHTFGRHMVEAKVPVTSIQRLLGHARLRTTEIYLHVSDTRVQADYEAAITLVEEQLSTEGDER